MYVDSAQVEVSRDNYTESVYESCGFDQCNLKILEALGVGEERFTDQETFMLDIEGEVVTVVLRRYMDERGSCSWCFGCGDFLVHGQSCQCKEEGKIGSKYEDREPLEPLVNVTGMLELRPFQGAT